MGPAWTEGRRSKEQGSPGLWGLEFQASRTDHELALQAGNCASWPEWAACSGLGLGSGWQPHLHSGSMALALPLFVQPVSVSKAKRGALPYTSLPLLSPEGPLSLLGSWRLVEKSKGIPGRKQRKRLTCPWKRSLARERVLGSYTRS